MEILIFNVHSLLRFTMNILMQNIESLIFDIYNEDKFYVYITWCRKEKAWYSSIVRFWTMQIIIYSKYFCFWLAKIPRVSYCRPNLEEFCDMLTAPARKVNLGFLGKPVVVFQKKPGEPGGKSWLSRKAWNLIPIGRARKAKKARNYQRISWLCSRKGWSN